MCGRFTLTVNPAELQGFAGFAFPSQFAPRFNIAPGQPVLAIPNDSKYKADFFLWGLIPSWAKADALTKRMINARGETLAEKPFFRSSYKYKRCLILADGFYEWQAQPKSKTKIPYFIHMRDGNPFAFAGLWDEWHSPEGGTIRTCAIITTAPNELMSALHNRMPVILEKENYAEWLDPAPRAPETLQHLLQPFDSQKMTARPVSILVNNPSNDVPECIAPFNQ